MDSRTRDTIVDGLVVLFFLFCLVVGVTMLIKVFYAAILIIEVLLLVLGLTTVYLGLCKGIDLITGAQAFPEDDLMEAWTTLLDSVIAFKNGFVVGFNSFYQDLQKDDATEAVLMSDALDAAFETPFERLRTPTGRPIVVPRLD